MSSPSAKPHEAIRVRVVELLRGILKEVLEEKYRLTKDPRVYTTLKIVESPDIVLIIPQEVYVSPTERKSIDMAFGNKVIFELKSGEEEFDKAVEDAKEKYLNKPTTMGAQFFIVTNYNKWRIYRIVDGGELQLEFSGDVVEARSVLKQVVVSFKELKLYPLPESVVRLYTIDVDALLSKLRDVFRSVKGDLRVKPLYEAYKSVMKMLYGGAGEQSGEEVKEEFFEDLFVRHTYMHMVVLTSLTFALGKIGRPEDVASGSLLEIDVALPYLNWWKVALHDPRIREVIEEIVFRASLVDWGPGLRRTFSGCCMRS